VVVVVVVIIIIIIIIIKLTLPLQHLLFLLISVYKFVLAFITGRGETMVNMMLMMMVVMMRQAELHVNKLPCRDTCTV